MRIGVKKIYEINDMDFVFVFWF